MCEDARCSEVVHFERFQGCRSSERNSLTNERDRSKQQISSGLGLRQGDIGLTLFKGPGQVDLQSWKSNTLSWKGTSLRVRHVAIAMDFKPPPHPCVWITPRRESGVPESVWLLVPPSDYLRQNLAGRSFCADRSETVWSKN